MIITNVPQIPVILTVFLLVLVSTLMLFAMMTTFALKTIVVLPPAVSLKKTDQCWTNNKCMEASCDEEEG